MFQSTVSQINSRTVENPGRKFVPVDFGRKYKTTTAGGTIPPVSGRFASGSFRPRSVRLRIESIRLRLICQFAYESDVEALNLNY